MTTNIETILNQEFGKFRIPESTKERLTADSKTLLEFLEVLSRGGCYIVGSEVKKAPECFNAWLKGEELRVSPSVLERMFCTMYNCTTKDFLKLLLDLKGVYKLSHDLVSVTPIHEFFSENKCL